ncbi:hypothetical protein CCYA_CCYA06G1887 [Cyanidiococcus yangmingshanensis]|nr:hypothetical protein CCYA_CCYA06G1887 [Cyanidiococcus yangmingshanensis]
MLTTDAVSPRGKKNLYGTGLRAIARDYYVVKTLCKRLAAVELELHRARRLCRSWAQALASDSEHTTRCSHRNRGAGTSHGMNEATSCPYREALQVLFREVVDRATAFESLDEIERVGANATCLGILQGAEPNWKASKGYGRESSAPRRFFKPYGVRQAPPMKDEKRTTTSAGDSKPVGAPMTQAAPQSTSGSVWNIEPVALALSSTRNENAATQCPSSRLCVAENQGSRNTVLTLDAHPDKDAIQPVTSSESVTRTRNQHLVDALLETQEDALVGCVEQERLQTQLSLLRGVMAELQLLLEECPCEAFNGDVAPVQLDDALEAALRSSWDSSEAHKLSFDDGNETDDDLHALIESDTGHCSHRGQYGCP